MPNSYRGATSTLLISGSAGDIKTATAPTDQLAMYISVASDDCYLTLAGATPGPTAGLILYAGNNPQFFPINRIASNPQFAAVTGGARIFVTFLL